MTKRSLRQKEVVSYALLRGKLVPRREALTNTDSQPTDKPKKPAKQAVDYDALSAKQLKDLLAEKGIDYPANASKQDLIALLAEQEHSDFKIK